MKTIRKLIKSFLILFPGGKFFIFWWQGVRRSIDIKIRRHRLQKHGKEILSRVFYALADNPRIAYHADYGTLLGLVREKGFIKHDDDIDFSVYSGTISPKDLCDSIIGAGFKFLRGFRYDGVVTELAFIYKKVSVDFFYVFPTESDGYSQVYNDFRSDEDGDRAYFAERLTKPRLADVIEVDFRGVKVKIPANSEDFLRYSYGKGWAVPVKNWKRDDGDIGKRMVLEGTAEIFYHMDNI